MFTLNEPNGNSRVALRVESSGCAARSSEPSVQDEEQFHSDLLTNNWCKAKRQVV